jgi:hypothetical protein
MTTAQSQIYNQANKILELLIDLLIARGKRIKMNGLENLRDKMLCKEEIIKEKGKELLESVAQMEKELTSLRTTNIQPSKILRGNEIMMELLINLKNMQIISEEHFTDFLNKENQAQVIVYCTQSMKSLVMTVFLCVIL